jgi:hypothetical protein
MGGCVGGERSQAKMALQWLTLVLLLVGPTCAQTNSQNESWPVDGEYMEYLDDQDVLLDGNNGTLLNDTSTNRTRSRYKGFKPAYGTSGGDPDSDWDLMPVLAMCVIVGLATVAVGVLMGCFRSSERKSCDHQAAVDKIILDDHDHDKEIVYDDDFTLAASATQLSSTVSSGTDMKRAMIGTPSRRHHLPQVHQRPAEQKSPFNTSDSESMLTARLCY